MYGGNVIPTAGKDDGGGGGTGGGDDDDTASKKKENCRKPVLRRNCGWLRERYDGLF